MRRLLAGPYSDRFDYLVKCTQYFLAMRTRPDRIGILNEWVQREIQAPILEVVQADGRIRRLAQIPEQEGRYSRVVLLPDGETIHNAFFNRGFTR